MIARSDFAFVIAVYPNSRGIAFTVFEGPWHLVDWGTRGARRRHDHAQHLGAAGRLLEHYWPPILVLENTRVAGSRRGERVRALNEALTSAAEERGVPVSSHSRDEVREVFGGVGARTKAAIADAIAARVPALERHVPPPRKPWMSEHARMGIFDAAALALTFFSGAGFDFAPHGQSPPIEPIPRGDESARAR